MHFMLKKRSLQTKNKFGIFVEFVCADLYNNLMKICYNFFKELSRKWIIVK